MFSLCHSGKLSTQNNTSTGSGTFRTNAEQNWMRFFGNVFSICTANAFEAISLEKNLYPTAVQVFTVMKPFNHGHGLKYLLKDETENR